MLGRRSACRGLSCGISGLLDNDGKWISFVFVYPGYDQLGTNHINGVLGHCLRIVCSIDPVMHMRLTLGLKSLYFNMIVNLY